MKEPPLIIDLDGTLLCSDLLIETCLLFFRDNPHRFFTLLQWLVRGKATLKSKLAHATEIDAATLPYNNAVIEFIEHERKRGRQIVLATASHRQLAEQVAEHLCLFDEVIATEENRNLSAQAKKDTLVQRFGERGFDYVGNSRDDLPVWKAARQAYLANASPSLTRKAQRTGNVAGALDTRRTTPADWINALRLYQWLKNLLLFIPLLAAHRFTEWPLIKDAFLAFFCFGLCASSVYILNDLLDIQDDRHHARKQKRPLASGRVPIQSGLIVFPLLLIAAFGLGIRLLPFEFTIGLATYYILTLAYSMCLKRWMIIDVITLAMLYTIRVIVGGVTLAIPLSFWLLTFSMFIFLSLALIKRYAELYPLRLKNNNEKARGRGYFPSDLQMIASMGTASSYMAVLVLALYINDGRTTELYSHHKLIWMACPLLLIWVSRMWMLAHRGVMNEDPLIFALSDRMSLVIGALLILVLWGAI